MKKLIIILFIAHCSLQIAEAQQPTLEWMNVVEGVNADAMCIDSAGNVFISGMDDFTPPGFTVAKFNNTGQRLWLSRFVGGGGLRARPVKIGCDPQGNIYVSGYDDTYFLIKYNTAGAQLWYKRFDGTWLSDLDITQTGEPIITGYVYNGSQTNIDYYTVKCNSTGDTVWTATYNNPLSNLNDIPKAMVESDNQTICITGVTDISITGLDMLTLKYNQSGILQWVRIYGDINSDSGIDVATDLNGNSIITGYARLGQTYPRYCTIKYLPNGDTAWVRIYHHPQNNWETPQNISTDNTGNIVITGTGVMNPFGNNIVTVKYDTFGNLLWQKSYSHPYNGYSFSLLNNNEALALDKIDNIYITGVNNLWPRNARDLVAFKYNSNGDLLWDITYVSPDSISSGDNIIVDKNFNVYLHGLGQLPSGGPRGAIVLKYSQLIGIEPISNEVPGGYKLHQNYPNPFNPVTKIKFEVPKLNSVKLLIYDLLGKEIITLVNEELKPGVYEIDFNASQYSSGVYFYKLESGSFNQTKKMLILK